MVSSRRIVAPSIVAAVAFAAVGVAIEVFFLRTVTGQRLDASTFGAVTEARDQLGPWADRLRLGLPAAAGALALLLFVVALVRRKWRSALVSAGLVVAALLVSTVLKDFVISRPALGDFGYPENTFPSGHTVVAVAALVASFWLLPQRHPVLIVLFALFAGLAGLMQVVSYAHRLSDVLAGALLVGVLAALVPPGNRLPLRWSWPSWVGVGLAAAAGTACLVGWETSGYATDHDIAATVGLALCAIASAGAALIVAAGRRPDGRFRPINGREPVSAVPRGAS